MKFSILAVVAAAAACASASTLGSKDSLYFQRLQGSPRYQKRQNFLIPGVLQQVTNTGYGKVADPNGAAPRRVEIQRRNAITYSKSVKIRSGPYKVPSMIAKQWWGENGTLWNYPDLDVAKPCETCVVLGMNVNLEYPDGSPANLTTGMWLHHYVQFALGNNHFDATCRDAVSLPHMAIGESGATAERVFSASTELGDDMLQGFDNTTKTGYHLRPADKYAFLVDLMNETNEDKVVYLTVTYDYVDDKAHVMEFQHMRPVWFDIEECGISERPPPKESGNFVVESKPWKANFNGTIVGAAGHVHDGGVNITVEADGKVACGSFPTYGTEQGGGAEGGHNHGGTTPPAGPEETMPGMGQQGGSNSTMPMDMGEEGQDSGEHVVGMSYCAGDKLGVKTLQNGQTWTLKAFYDYDKYKPSFHNGHVDNIMGISIMMVRSPPPPLEPPADQGNPLLGLVGTAVGLNIIGNVWGAAQQAAKQQ